MGNPLAFIEATGEDKEFCDYLRDLLVELCAIDTTPRPDVAAMKEAESHCFKLIERELHQAQLPGLTLTCSPIDEKIANHPFFSNLYYTRTTNRPDGLDVKDCYAGRCNLVASVKGEEHTESGVNQAINVHVDVVSPFMPPSVTGSTVHGRGACDDKGNVVALLGAMKLLGMVLQKADVQLNRDLTCMFVIDEESGGNGSLSCAIDETLKQRYDSMLVLECTGGRLHPGNRGCVWYRVEGEVADGRALEAAAFIVDELEADGRAIRAESDHVLFPHRPVQTCHGIIGDCGEHPSRINGDVSFEIDLTGADQVEASLPTIRDSLETGLARYIATYGDKTKDIDGIPGSAKVDRHYDMKTEGHVISVRVFGSTGHMGAIAENDGAITKMAHMVLSLVQNRAGIESTSGGEMRLSLQGWPEPSRILLEGGQGFLPTHELGEIKSRMEAAVDRGIRRYTEAIGVTDKSAGRINVTFDKLHNAAYAQPADSTDMTNGIEAARAAGLPNAKEILGWDVSCDARIFACEHPSLPVITAGAGLLEYAHSDHERIEIEDVSRMACFLVHFILRQTDTKLSC